jgi:hypothetical protein
MAKDNKPQKGVAGKKTGGAARKAISAARKKGSSTKQIATAAMRSESTIGQIAAGSIKNPPANLAGKVRKAKRTKRK